MDVERLTSMDEYSLIDFLEELAEKFGVRIRYEAIRQDEDAVFVAGGLCLLKGEYVLIVNSKATVRERVHTLATALKHFDLDQVYIRPAIRELLDKIPEQERFNR
jgi:hypothetical protein